MAELYVRQLLAGRDFAKSDLVAGRMQNFVYLVGDREKRECVVVDPAWDVAGILEAAQADDMKITAALVTHYHPDHCGGTMFGYTVQGLPTLLELNPVRTHVHDLEADGVAQVTGLSEGDLVRHASGDKVAAGDVEIELLHTPGHTPGSLCFRIPPPRGEGHGVLVAGDTLFLQGCGRVDLPGGDADEMFRTLNERLSTLPDDMVLLPGHAYGGERGALGEVRKNNPTLQIKDLAAWRQTMG